MVSLTTSWIAYCTNYWCTIFSKQAATADAAAEAMKAFFAEFKAELASDDFLAEYHLFCKRLPDVPTRFQKLDVPIGKLQQVSREAEEGAGRLCEMDRSTVSLPLEISAIPPACMLSILLVAGVSYLHKN